MLQVFDFSFHAMGSPCSLQFFADSPARAEAVFRLVEASIEALEQRYSRYRGDSLLSEINRRAGGGVKTALDAETFALLQYADQCWRESGHLFDVTSGVLRRVWGHGQTQLPDKQNVAALLPLIGWQKVEWSADAVYLPRAGMELDFGGIVKEYAADVAVGICRQQGIRHGIVELGGDIGAIGPLPDGQGWPVAIRDPRRPDKIVAQFRLAKGALASSGDYERFLLIDGERYSHLLDPRTGWPVAGLRAVSIVAEHCVVAGSVATIAMLKAKKGLAWLRGSGLPFLCCQSDGRLIDKLTH